MHKPCYFMEGIWISMYFYEAEVSEKCSPAEGVITAILLKVERHKYFTKWMFWFVFWSLLYLCLYDPFIESAKSLHTENLSMNIGNLRRLESAHEHGTCRRQNTVMNTGNMRAVSVYWWCLGEPCWVLSINTLVLQVTWYLAHLVSPAVPGLCVVFYCIICQSFLFQIKLPLRKYFSLDSIP